MAEDSSLKIQQIAAATSSGSMIRLMAWCWTKVLYALQSVERRRRFQHGKVRVEPGETALAVTPVPARSSARRTRPRGLRA